MCSCGVSGCSRRRRFHPNASIIVSSCGRKPWSQREERCEFVVGSAECSTTTTARRHDFSFWTILRCIIAQVFGFSTHIERSLEICCYHFGNISLKMLFSPNRRHDHHHGRTPDRLHEAASGCGEFSLALGSLASSRKVAESCGYAPDFFTRRSGGTMHDF